LLKRFSRIVAAVIFAGWASVGYSYTYNNPIVDLFSDDPVLSSMPDTWKALMIRSQWKHASSPGPGSQTGSNTEGSVCDGDENCNDPVSVQEFSSSGPTFSQGVVNNAQLLTGVDPGVLDPTLVSEYLRDCVGLGFSGTDSPCSASFSEVTFDPTLVPDYIHDCVGLGFSGTDSPCPGSPADTAFDPTVVADYIRDCTTLGFSGTDVPCPGAPSENAFDTVDIDPALLVTAGDEGGGSTGDVTVGGAGGTSNSLIQDPGLSPGLSYEVGSAQPAADVDAPTTLALMGLGLLALRYYRRPLPRA